MKRLTPGTAQQDCQQDIQQIHCARSQVGIRQVSSCLASVGADHLSDGRSSFVAQGLAACAAAAGGSGPVVILSCYHSRQLDPEEPAGAEGEVPGCESRLAGIAPSDSKRTI